MNRKMNNSYDLTSANYYLLTWRNRPRFHLNQSQIRIFQPFKLWWSQTCGNKFIPKSFEWVTAPSFNVIQHEWRRMASRISYPYVIHLFRLDDYIFKSKMYVHEVWRVACLVFLFSRRRGRRAQMLGYKILCADISSRIIVLIFLFVSLLPGLPLAACLLFAFPTIHVRICTTVIVWCSLVWRRITIWINEITKIDALAQQWT